MEELHKIVFVKMDENNYDYTSQELKEVNEFIKQNYTIIQIIQKHVDKKIINLIFILEKPEKKIASML